MSFNFNINIGNIIQAITLVYLVVKAKDSESAQELTNQLLSISSRIISSSSDDEEEIEDLESGS